jgi:hypothetical protein
MWKVQWSDSDWRLVSSLAELDATLDAIHAEAASSYPRLIQIASPDGSVMHIGLGLSESVLTYVPPEKWPSLTSRGNLHSSEDETILFYMGDCDCEMPATYAIPIDVARRAVDSYVESGRLLDDVRWEHD